MPHIETKQRAFTGTVGRVRFTEGHADTELADELEHFRDHPDTYAVSDTAPEYPWGDGETEDTDPQE